MTPIIPVILIAVSFALLVVSLLALGYSVRTIKRLDQYRKTKP